MESNQVKPRPTTRRVAKKVAVGRRWGKWLCFLIGHPTRMTGRNLTMLYQVRCERCERLFCGHIDETMLVPWTPVFEQLFIEHEAAHPKQSKPPKKTS